jgi:hypothetical protein
MSRWHNALGFESCSTETCRRACGSRQNSQLSLYPQSDEIRLTRKLGICPQTRFGHREQGCRFFRPHCSQFSTAASSTSAIRESAKK